VTPRHPSIATIVFVAWPNTRYSLRCRPFGITAGHWGTAAIVHAWTDNQQGTQGDQKKVSDRLGFQEFAALGIRGLSSVPSVRKYRRAWEWAIAEGWGNLPSLVTTGGRIHPITCPIFDRL
jgi:hypothetical protein